MYILKKHLLYLDYLISGEGMFLLQENMASLVKLPPPTDVTETSHSISFGSYYTKFIVNVRDIMRPINELTKNIPSI